MKRITSLLLYFFIIFLSCENPDKPTSKTDSVPQQEAGVLNGYLKKFEDTPQTFTVSSSKPTKVKGKKGTTIFINPSNLETVDGKPVEEKIQVELKELTSQQELLRANAQTVSNGQLLESGGAYYINMTSNGKQLKLKSGKSLSVVFPKLTNKEMSLFYGQRDSLGQMNWVSVDAQLIVNQRSEPTVPAVTQKTAKKKSDIDAILEHIESGDTTILPVKYTEKEREEMERAKVEEEKRDAANRTVQRFYEAIDIQTFGWINIDKLLEEYDKTNLIVSINPADSVVEAAIYLLFKDINSVMQRYYFDPAKAGGTQIFEELPVGSKTRLIAFTAKEGHGYAFSADIILNKDQKVNIAFKPVTEQEFKNLLSK